MESGNDYVIQVKRNARNVLRSITDYIATNEPTDVHTTAEKVRGRVEKRTCFVYSMAKAFELYQDSFTVIHMLNEGVRNGKPYEESHYYVSNKRVSDAVHFATGIRGHWAIENSMHWVKDAVMYEDNSKVKGMNLSGKLSILRNIVMNIYRLNDIWSITKAIQKYCNRIPESLQLIDKIHIRSS